jgi:hypothetical protein
MDHRSDQEISFCERGSVAAAATAVATTVVATATAEVAATAATAAAATATAAAGLSFVDADGATHPLNILEIFNCLGLFGLVGHFDKGETALAAGVAVEGEAALAHLSVLAEQMLDIFRFRIEGKIADVNGHELRNYELILRRPNRKWSAR